MRVLFSAALHGGINIGDKVVFEALSVRYDLVEQIISIDEQSVVGMSLPEVKQPHQEAAAFPPPRHDQASTLKEHGRLYNNELDLIVPELRNIKAILSNKQISNVSAESQSHVSALKAREASLEDLLTAAKESLDRRKAQIKHMTKGVGAGDSKTPNRLFRMQRAGRTFEEERTKTIPVPQSWRHSSEGRREATVSAEKDRLVEELGKAREQIERLQALQAFCFSIVTRQQAVQPQRSDGVSNFQDYGNLQTKSPLTHHVLRYEENLSRESVGSSDDNRPPSFRM
eukprot:761422-Hanusia_phi.AAC.1